MSPHLGIATLAIFALACDPPPSPPDHGAEAGLTDAGAPDRSDGVPGGPSESDVVDLLAGHFDSADQAARDPSFIAVRRTTCRVPAPFLGEDVLYLEESTLAFPRSPFRQSIHVVSASDAASGEFVIAEFKLVDEVLTEAMVGACDRPDTVALASDDLSLRRGCELAARLRDDGLRARTIGQACVGTRRRRFVTEDLLALPDQLEQWRRELDEDGTQISGPQNGPVIYQRRD